MSVTPDEEESAPRRDMIGGARIAEIRTTIVNVPLVAPYIWAAGRYPGVSRVIVEVETADGVVGLGEAPHWRHDALIREELAPRLVGLDGSNLRACWTRAIPPTQVGGVYELPDYVRAYGGIELALWDVRARMAGVPLYHLLGGAARTQIPFTEYFTARVPTNGHGGERSPREIAAYCARMIEEHDSPAFEGKVGYTDLATDVAIAREVRSAIGPDRVLRLDANKGWTLDTARAALSRLEAFDVANVEDPVASFEEMARLRLHSRIPFSTHSPDLRRALALGAPDAFVIHVFALGGVQQTLKFIAACEATGINFWFYSGDTGIGTAAYLHLAAAEPYVKASQSLLRWYADDVIEGGPFVPEHGVVAVPDGPGLGVTLDRAALARCHRRFLDDGPMEYGTGAHGAYPQLPLY